MRLPRNQLYALRCLAASPTGRASTEYGSATVYAGAGSFRRATFGALARRGLVARVYSPTGYVLTDAGRELLAATEPTDA